MPWSCGEIMGRENFLVTRTVFNLVSDTSLNLVSDTEIYL